MQNTGNTVHTKVNLLKEVLPLLPALGRKLLGLYNVLSDKCLFLGIHGSHQTVYANDVTYGGGLKSSRIKRLLESAKSESIRQETMQSMEFHSRKILDIENCVNLCGW